MSIIGTPALSRPRTIITAIILTIALAPSMAAAQAVPEASVAFTLGIPTGEFSDNVPGLGVGIDLTGGIQFAGTPIFLGAELGFLIHGREVRREPFSTTIPDVEVMVITTNNIMNGHLFLRLQPGVGDMSQ